MSLDRAFELADKSPVLSLNCGMWGIHFNSDSADHAHISFAASKRFQVRSFAEARTELEQLREFARSLPPQRQFKKSVMERTLTTDYAQIGILLDALEESGVFFKRT